MIKLELKHLAPYMPHFLKVKCNDGYIRTLSDKGGLSNVSLSAILDSDDIEEYKPILKPLTDLKISKEVQINLGLHTKVDIDFCIEDPTSMSYTDINLLMHYRFDVFKLIGKGLALDVNILTNTNLDSDYKTFHINQIMSVYADYDRENCLDEIQKILEEQPIEYLQSLHEKVVGDR